MSRYAPKHCANRGGVGSAKGFAAVLFEWTLRCPLYLASAALLIAAALLVALLPIPLEGAYELNPATYADGDFLDNLANDYGDEVLQYAGAVSQAHTGAEAYSALAQLMSYEASLGREGAGQLAWFASSLAGLSTPETFASTHEAPALFLAAWALGGGVPYVVWFLPCVAAIASVALMTSRGMVLGRVPVSPRKTLVAMAACILVCGAAPVLLALGITFAKGLLNGGLGDAAYPVMVGTAGQATLIEALTGSVCLLVAGLAALTMCGAALVRISRSAPLSLAIVGAALAIPLVLGSSGLAEALGSILAQCAPYYLDFGRISGCPGYTVPQAIPPMACASHGIALQLVTCATATLVALIALSAQFDLKQRSRRGSGDGMRATHFPASGNFTCACEASAGTHAVEALISLEPGGVCVLRAPNGTGKTTLLRALCADPVGRVQGTARIAGIDICDVTRYRGRIAYASNDDPGLCPWMTVRGLMRAVRAIWPQASTVAHVEQRCGVAGFDHKLIRALSSGMRQRVVLAAAFQTGAACLLLDEPTSSLDIIASDEVVALINEFAARGGCALVASHDGSVDPTWGQMRPTRKDAGSSRVLFCWPDRT